MDKQGEKRAASKKAYYKKWSAKNPDYQKQRGVQDKNYQKIWKDKNPTYHLEYARKSSLKKRYGITVEDYNKLYDEQNGKCKICKRHASEFKRRLAVDHSHTTGVVRGLLCANCNSILGKAKENPSILENCIIYLKQ